MLVRIEQMPHRYLPVTESMSFFDLYVVVLPLEGHTISHIMSAFYL